MKITGNYYNFIQPKQIRQQNSLKLKPALQQDVVCFRGKDLLALPEIEVLSMVKEAIAPENFLGQGTEAEVYRIKDTDYCVRIPYVAQNIYNTSYSKELAPTDKVNHIVAKLGFGASIMKYFDGVIPKWYMNNNYNRYSLQEKIADFPVKSYSKLLHQIANAVDNEMLFDFSGGNLIVDTEKQKLTAIDFYGISDNPRPVKPLTEMYSALTCYGSAEKTGKKIFNKIADTGLEEFKPGKIPCMDLDLFDFEALCFKRCHDSYTEKHENLINEISRQLKTLKSIKKAEIIDKTKGLLLEQNISTVKNLLSKIH